MKLSLQKIKKIISKLPDKPGVYKFLRGKNILYIGKATSIRDRVRSYFSTDILDSRGPVIYKMLSDFNRVTYEETDSVLEALILEANLIKKYQPEANMRDKDNKSFNYVVITKEKWPRILIKRGRELAKFSEPSSREKAFERDWRENEEFFSRKIPYFSRDAAKKNFSISKYFGPYPNGGQLREALKIIRRMFPYRDEKCVPAEEQKGAGRPCFNRQIGLCPGICTGEISKDDYGKIVKNISLFFEGNKKKILQNMNENMKSLARRREFEEAEKIKRKIFALTHIQDVALIKNGNGEEHKFRIESYDIAHLSGTNVVGVMTVVEGGEIKKSDYRKFKIKNDPGANDVKALSEVLSRRLGHPEWPLPDLIVVDGGTAQINAMKNSLQKYGMQIPVVSVVKDERHKPREIIGIERLSHFAKASRDIKDKILLANSESHRFAISFHKHLRGKSLY